MHSKEFGDGEDKVIHILKKDLRKVYIEVNSYQNMRNFQRSKKRTLLLVDRANSKLLECCSCCTR